MATKARLDSVIANMGGSSGTLSGLSDVDTSGIRLGDILHYKSSTATKRWSPVTFGFGMRDPSGTTDGLIVDSTVVATQYDLTQVDGSFFMGVVTGGEPYLHLKVGTTNYHIVLTPSGPDTISAPLASVATGAEPYLQFTYDDTLHRVVLTTVP